MPGDEELLVALVVLRPASGQPIAGETRITAENLPQYAPSPRDAEQVSRALEDAGFRVGPLAGISLAMTGSRSRFERYFGTTIHPEAQGGWLAVGRDGVSARELPLDALPAALRSRVHAVTFEEPGEPVGTEGARP